MHRTAMAEEAPLVLDEVPVPEPAPDEVLVRVHVCSVCRTDLHVVEGDLPETRRPLTPGHMVVGTVEELGASVEASDVRLGDRVGVAWLRGTCGSCELCASIPMHGTKDSFNVAVAFGIAAARVAEAMAGRGRRT